MAKTVRKQFYLSLDLNGLLSEDAHKKNISEAEVIRRALIDYLLKQYSLPKDESISSLAGIGVSGRKRVGGEND